MKNVEFVPLGIGSIGSANINAIIDGEKIFYCDDVGDEGDLLAKELTKNYNDGQKLKKLVNELLLLYKPHGNGEPESYGLPSIRNKWKEIKVLLE